MVVEHPGRVLRHSWGCASPGEGYPDPVESSVLPMKITRHLDSKIKVNTTMYKNSQKSPFFGDGAHSIFLQKWVHFQFATSYHSIAIVQSKFEVRWTPRDSRNPRNVLELFRDVPRPFRGLLSQFFEILNKKRNFSHSCSTKSLISPEKTKVTKLPRNHPKWLK